MPIVHNCKACGCSVTDQALIAGRGTRNGKDVYCAECAALIMEPVETSTPVGGMRAMSANVAKPLLAGRPSTPKAAAPAELPENRPTGKQDPLRRDGIEVVEEFEILSAAPDVPDLSRELSEDGDDEDAEAGVETSETEPEPEANAPAGTRGRRLRRRRGASAMRKRSGRGPSQRGIPAAIASRREAPARPAVAEPHANAPEPRRLKAEKSNQRPQKEVFYKSGSKNKVQPAVEAEIAERHAQSVDSNVLDAVRSMKEARRHARSNTPSAGPAGSQRMSHRGGAIRDSGGKSTQMIFGVVAVLLLVVVLIASFSSGGSSGPAKKQKETSEEYLPAGAYAQRAEAAFRAGRKQEAADLYLKAAEAASNSGNSAEAERYNQAAYQLKFKTAY